MLLCCLKDNDIARWGCWLQFRLGQLSSLYQVTRGDWGFPVFFLLCPSHKVLSFHGIYLRPLRGDGQIFRWIAIDCWGGPREAISDLLEVTFYWFHLNQCSPISSWLFSVSCLVLSVLPTTVLLTSGRPVPTNRCDGWLQAARYDLGSSRVGSG